MQRGGGDFLRLEESCSEGEVWLEVFLLPGADDPAPVALDDLSHGRVWTGLEDGHAVAVGGVDVGAPLDL